VVSSSRQSTAGAYRHCARVTRKAAANFYYGISLLPPDNRRAMCAAYAFARRIDDIGDGPLARAEKLALLDEQAQALRDLSKPGADPVLIALADAHARFTLPLDAVGDLIEGVRMDVEGPVFEAPEELLLYCRHVAGSIGRLCLAIFGCRDPQTAGRMHAQRLADDLGVAMQLTNILRDIREDAQNGRVYLPLAEMRRFGLIAAGESRHPPVAVAALRPGEVAMFDEFVRFEAERAHEWYDRGMPLVELLDRRSAACLLAMAGIYRKLLRRIEADPERILEGRVSVPIQEKGWIAARGVLGAAF
jgi:15-cis-phytoene synthase